MTRFGTRSAAKAVLVGAVARNCRGRMGRNRRPEQVSVVGGYRDARRRPLLRDQDSRSPACLRADGFDCRPRYLRHVLHVQGRRPGAPDTAARPLVDGVQGREDICLQPSEERPLRGRNAAHLRRRRLLVSAPDQPQGQPVFPARRRHRLGAWQVHGRAALDHPGDGAAVDPDEHVARDRQLEARAQARRHFRGRCGQERQGRAVAELGSLPRRG